MPDLTGGIAMITAIYLYNLRDNVDIEDYKKWSVECDQKTVNSFGGIKSFKVFINQDPGKKYDIFEVIRVESWERWVEIGRSPEMEKLKKQHKELVDRQSMIKLYGEEII